MFAQGAIAFLIAVGLFFILIRILPSVVAWAGRFIKKSLFEADSELSDKDDKTKT